MPPKMIWVGSSRGERRPGGARGGVFRARAHFDSQCWEHPGRSKAKQDVEEFVGAAAQQASGQYRDVAGARGQGSERVALRRDGVANPPDTG
jgi:hypothetical protein